MKKIIIGLVSVIVLSSILTNTKNNKTNNIIIEHEANANTVDYDSITMKQICDYLQNKREHYPLSDEFIERYQQSSGGYIDYARQLGLTVNKELHEPNQKWHFFTSWYEYKLNENTISETDLAKGKVWSNLACPELLLWIYEACDAPIEKIKKAKEVAEKGKVEGLYATTIGKNMRAIVSWEDLAVNIVKGA